MTASVEDRAPTPHSFITVSAPEPTAFTTATARQKNMAAPTFNEQCLSPDGHFAGRKTDTLRTHRARALSNVSCVSNATWWSAVASVHEQPPERAPERETKSEPNQQQHDETVTHKDLDSGVALPKVQKRRESIKSTSTTRSSRRSSRRPSTSIDPSNRSTSGTTLQGRPSSSCATSQEFSWDSAQAITEARRLKRLEIKQSLTQKYPNDRVHGEFLPFSTGFSHSADSLSPVRFLPQTSSSRAETMVAPTPLEPTTIAWKNLDSLRQEYAAADKKKRSPWTWIRHRVLCGAGLLGCKAKKEFWEDGDEDKGSVRRYRLELPDKDETSVAVRVPVRVRSVESAMASSRRGTCGGEGKLMEPFEEEKTGQERWSTVGICEGKRVNTDTDLPDNFTGTGAATPVLGSTVRGIV